MLSGNSGGRANADMAEDKGVTQEQLMLAFIMSLGENIWGKMSVLTASSFCVSIHIQIATLTFAWQVKVITYPKTLISTFSL